MSSEQSGLDSVRHSCGGLENHIIDEFAAGRLTRAQFLRRGVVLGMSMSALGTIVAACGGSSSSSSSTSAANQAAKPGATIRVGMVAPTAVIDPVTVADEGGSIMLCQTGQHLTLANQALRLEPVLAESWKPNADATVWTFKIRKGVTFSDGHPLTADDVVYTYKLQSNPKGTANALSAFGGILVPDGVIKVDDYTVAFHLEAPNGNFPYLTSTDNYNMIIIPNGYDHTKWQTSFIGTGPFILKQYTQMMGAEFIPNPHYWGPKPLPAQTQFTFYSDQPSQILGLQGSTIDVATYIIAQGAEAILGGGYNLISLKSATHRELSMRCDKPPFTDPRVRQAIALTLNRPAIVTALFHGLAELGNDSPFAPVFASTDPSVPQRHQDLAKAKQLLAAAGHPNGFTTQLFTEHLQEIPSLAQIVKESAAQIGVTINLTVETSTAYYGKATFGNSDWLDGTMSLVDYAGRSIPNVLLEAPLVSGGAWNAAHFNNTTYDRLVKQYVAAIDLQTQRTIAGQIQRLLLEQTPIIYPYFYNELTVTAKNVTGVYPTQVGLLYLQNAGIS